MDVGKRITIKDIAKKASVSLGSVHCALNGKPGVSEDTRKRILAISEELHYQPNTIASSLKRKSLTIAAAIPALTGTNRYFYSDIWQGVRDCLDEMRDYNIELVPVPYYASGSESQQRELCDFLKDVPIDGLVSVGYTPVEGLLSLTEFKERHIPCVLVGNDVPDSSRLCSVLPDYPMVGAMVAELMLRPMQEDEEVLLCAGSMHIPSHYQTVEGFMDYVKSHDLKNPILVMNSEADNQMLNDMIKKALVKEKLKGAYSVTARDSVVLAEAIKDTGTAKKVFSVGTDVFNENKNALKNGYLDNLVQNNPYRCAFLATKILIGYLLNTTEKPSKNIIHVDSGLVFSSMLSHYDVANHQSQY